MWRARTQHQPRQIGTLHVLQAAPWGRVALILEDDILMAEEYIRDIVASSPLCPATAIFFTEHNNAFDRVSMQWAARVLQWWGILLWIQRDSAKGARCGPYEASSDVLSGSL